MSVANKVLKGSILLSAAQIISYGSSFLRNILLARVLTKTDFGIIASLSLTLMAFEVANKLSIGQQVVQSKHGDNPDFLAAAHFCQFLAGCCGTIIIAALGSPMAHLFDVPDASWAFMLISLLSVVSGLQHLDVMRSMRTLSFTKRVILDLVPELTLTVLAFPLILWQRDYRAMVMLMFAKPLVYMLLSHVLAEQPYRWKMDPGYIRSILLFGWPLVINALLMFGYQQGDQVLIGTNFSVASLAPYSLAVSITLAPGYMFQYVLNTIMLPLLSQAQDDPAKYKQRFLLCAELSTVVSVTIACLLILCGEWVISTVYGAKYAGTGPIVAWLAVANGLRIIRSVTVLAAMARGDTANNMFSNVFRTSSLGLSALAIVWGKSIVWIAACGCIGEALALGASWYRLAKKCGIPISLGVRSTSIGVGFMALSGAVSVGLLANHSWPVVIPVALAVCLAAFLVMRHFFGEFRHYLAESLRTIQTSHPILRIFG
ncbi:MAG TPA: oligosaccharide flippase family protein [Lacunisphaera sp.]|nr:oligosaccharide flippase family protein [Lacunisphaera sp.]